MCSFINSEQSILLCIHIVCTNHSPSRNIITTCKRCTTTTLLRSGRNAASKKPRNQQVQGSMTDKAQQRNEINNHPLTQRDILQIVQQMVDLLGERFTSTSDNRNKNLGTTCFSFRTPMVVEPPPDISISGSATTQSGTRTLMNDQRTVTS